MSKPTQIVYASLAGVSFGLGVVGLFLPLMPTTCFMLLAVWLASRGSPRFAVWIRQHPRFGPSVTAWECERAIPRHAKILAMIMLAISTVILGITLDSTILRAVLIGGLLSLAVWIATRPEPGRDSTQNTLRITGVRPLSDERLSTHRLGH